MSDHPERQADKDPAPLKHSDAERLSDDDSQSADAAQEMEDDPSRNPQEQELRDIKGG
jgi:hypothetical protein